MEKLEVADAFEIVVWCDYWEQRMWLVGYLWTCLGQCEKCVVPAEEKKGTCTSLFLAVGRNGET